MAASILPDNLRIHEDMWLHTVCDVAVVTGYQAHSQLQSDGSHPDI